MNFNNFTIKSQEALQQAQQIAQGFQICKEDTLTQWVSSELSKVFQNKSYAEHVLVTPSIYHLVPVS